MTTTKTVARLQYLHDMLVKYTNAYYRAVDAGREPSSRMYDWIDEYDDQRHTPAWAEYCRLTGAAESHCAADLFA